MRAPIRRVAALVVFAWSSPCQAFGPTAEECEPRPVATVTEAKEEHQRVGACLASRPTSLELQTERVGKSSSCGLADIYKQTIWSRSTAPKSGKASQKSGKASQKSGKAVWSKMTKTYAWSPYLLHPECLVTPVAGSFRGAAHLLLICPLSEASGYIYKTDADFEVIELLCAKGPGGEADHTLCATYCDYLQDRAPDRGSLSVTVCGAKSKYFRYPCADKVELMKTEIENLQADCEYLGFMDICQGENVGTPSVREYYPIPQAFASFGQDCSIRFTSAKQPYQAGEADPTKELKASMLFRKMSGKEWHPTA